MYQVRIVAARYGGPEVLEPREEPVPKPGRGEVRVRIEAAGVAYADLLMRQGLYPGGPQPPFTPGYDLVGRVDALDPALEEEPGARVAALSVSGSYAQYLCLPAGQLVRVPPELDAAEAVCLVLNYVTAWQMLHRAARVREGDTILVHGASGGVGTALTELARLAGVTVFGTASRAKHAAIAHLGARLIDYRTEDFVARVKEWTKGAGVQAVFDPVGGANLRRSYRCLARRGRLIVYGAISMTGRGRLKGYLSGAGSFLRLGLLDLLPDGRRARFYSILQMKRAHPAWFRDDLAHLFELLAGQRIRPVIAARLPLPEAARAHLMLEEGSATGKIVLIP